MEKSGIQVRQCTISTTCYCSLQHEKGLTNNIAQNSMYLFVWDIPCYIQDRKPTLLIVQPDRWWQDTISHLWMCCEASHTCGCVRLGVLGWTNLNLAAHSITGFPIAFYCILTNQTLTLHARGILIEQREINRNTQTNAYLLTT